MHVYVFLQERIMYNGNTRRISGITPSYVHIPHLILHQMSYNDIIILLEESW